MHLNPNEVVQHLQDYIKNNSDTIATLCEEFFGITEALVVDAIMSSLHEAPPDLLSVFVSMMFPFSLRGIVAGQLLVLQYPRQLLVLQYPRQPMQL